MPAPLNKKNLKLFRAALRRKSKDVTNREDRNTIFWDELKKRFDDVPLIKDTPEGQSLDEIIDAHAAQKRASSTEILVTVLSDPYLDQYPEGIRLRSLARHITPVQMGTILHLRQEHLSGDVCRTIIDLYRPDPEPTILAIGYHTVPNKPASSQWADEYTEVMKEYRRHDPGTLIKATLSNDHLHDHLPDLLRILTQHSTKMKHEIAAVHELGRCMSSSKVDVEEMGYMLHYFIKDDPEHAAVILRHLRHGGIRNRTINVRLLTRGLALYEGLTTLNDLYEQAGFTKESRRYAFRGTYRAAMVERVLG